ncbi:hypothetical protein [Streptomyces sp. NPDC054962]
MQSAKNWENGRSEPKSPRLDAYQRLLNGWAAKYPAPGAALAASFAASAPAPSGAPAASTVAEAARVWPLYVTAASPVLGEPTWQGAWEAEDFPGTKEPAPTGVLDAT